jgi:hypothetical protein
VKKGSFMPLLVLTICGLTVFFGCTVKPTDATQTGEITTTWSTQPTSNQSNIIPAPVSTTIANLQSPVPQAVINKPFPGNVILGSPTANSILVSLLASIDAEFYIEGGKLSGNYNWHTAIFNLIKNQPLQIEVTNLDKDTYYYYRVCYEVSGEMNYLAGIESSFYTQRSTSSTFSFGVQGDSHPERTGKMYDANLYTLNMNNVKANNPDFYFTLGDDFSIESLIEKNQLSQIAVNQIYAYQRNYLGLMADSTAVFLVNGNHEQAAKYLLDGNANNAAVLAGKARNQYYPLPTPGTFYSGDTEQIQDIGVLKDYYAWTWGDALFVVIDPYWHSSVAVDNVAGGGEKRTNMWDITLGDTQYRWFEQTLANSKAKYKFVFTHHILGTGRGGIEEAGFYEWGGYNQKGVWEFEKMRAGWSMPIHQLMVKYKVSIFFQGHDHLFAQQELDGVIYQEVPNPADPTYTAFNSDAYKSGKILANSGFLNVTVSSDRIRVDYIRSYLPKDETSTQKNGVAAYSYTVWGK